jgi:hypothetical protein
MINIKSSNLIIISISFIYSLIFIYLIPWTELKGIEFVDLINYTKRIVYLSNGGKEKEYFGLSIIFSEIVWKYILIYLGTIFTDPYFAISIISFISLFIYTYLILMKTNNYFLLILLFNPMFVDLIMGQVRIAFAFALLLITYELLIKKKYIFLSYILIIISILIHTAMLIIIIFSIYIYFFNNYFSNIKLYYLWAILIAFIAAFFLKFGADVILLSVGDKRANYAEVIEASSLKFSLFWFILAFFIFIYSKSTKKEENNIIIFSFIMIGLFFFSSLINAYGQRYVAISIPLILLSISFLKKNQQYFLYSLVFLYLILQYYYWAKIFNLI